MTLLLSLLCALMCSSALAAPAFWSVPSAPPAGPDMKLTVQVVPRIPGLGANATLVTVGNPVGHFNVFFPFAPSNPGRCYGWANVTSSGAAHGCAVAVNGGPFWFGNASTSCQGPLVSDSVLVQNADGFIVFGLTASNQFVFGALTSQQVAQGGFVSLLSGFSMLVVDGQAQFSNDPLVASRTIIGVDVDGRLLLLLVDGIEQLRQGWTIAEAAQYASALGMRYAVNLDGGGSTTLALAGGVLANRPTCHTPPFSVCERAVTTIVCIQ